MGIDTELQANLNKAKSGRMMFAFAHKGSAGSLLVDRKISGKDAAKAKEKAGGGTLFRGRCFGEEGLMIFEVAKEPPSALEAAIKRTINLEAGLSLKVVVRFAADAEGEAEVNGQEPQALANVNGAVPEAPPQPQQKAPIPPPAPPSGDAAFKLRLKAVQAQLSAAGGPTPDQQLLLNQAFSAARNKDYAAALDTLKEIDGSKKAKKEEPDTLESTTFKRALADLKPRFDQARVINSDLLPQMGQVLSVSKANRYADALEMLDKLEIEVDRTLASVPKRADTGAKFKARLKAMLPNYNAAIKEDPALLAKLRPLMSQVITLSNGDQFDQASVFLIQIEKALNITKPADVADAVMNRFTGLKAAIKAALSAGGPNVARIQTLVGAVGGLLKNKDTAQADKILDELEPLLKPAKGAGAADLGAEWKTKLAQWSPGIKAAMVAKGPNAAAIAKLLAQATALSKPGGDMAQAIAALTKCNALATTGAVPEEPDAEVKTATISPDADKANVKSRLAEAKKQLDQIKAANPAGARSLSGLLMQAISLSQTKEYADAQLRLDEFDKQLALLKSAADAPESKGEEKAESEEKEPREGEGEEDAKVDSEDQAETVQSAEAAEFEKQLKTMLPRLNKLLDRVRKSSPADAVKLESQWAKAMSANQAENHALAADLLKKLDASVTALWDEAKAAAKLRKAAGPENAVYVASKQVWDSVRAKAHAELKKFQQTVLNDPVTKADPRFDDSIVPAINGLDAALASFDDARLGSALQEAADLPADQKGPAIQKALDLIDAHRKNIEASREIATMDSGVYGTVNVGGTLTAALDTMTVRLNKRLKAMAV